MSDMIYQFKILLQDSKPPIWRRIQVPESYSFWDFHVAIQDSMGWHDCHLHEFDIKNPKTFGEDRIGIPDEEWGDQNVLPGWEANISAYFSLKTPIAEYTYNFGDCWLHIITLEKIIPAKKNTDYPQCITGKRACPPENCGGMWGYKDLLAILSDPHHEENESRLEWLEDDFDPETFDPAAFDLKEILFEDPKKRFEFFAKTVI